MKKVAITLALTLILSIPALALADGDHGAEATKVTATQRLEEAKSRMELIDAKLDIMNLAKISTQREIEALTVIIRIEKQLDEARAKKEGGAEAPAPAPEAPKTEQ